MSSSDETFDSAGSSASLTPGRAARDARPTIANGRAQGNLGARLRSLRQEYGYSLAEVAAATHISASFLSLVETGRSDITLGRLMRLLRFYGVSITDVLSESDSADPQVVRRHEAQEFDSPREGIKIFVLTRDTHRTMMPYLGLFEPGAHPVERAEHEGEEFVHILEGTIRIDVEGSEPAVLHAGDSAYFSADRPHSMTNLGDRPARVVGVVTPPNL